MTDNFSCVVIGCICVPQASCVITKTTRLDHQDKAPVECADFDAKCDCFRKNLTSNKKKKGFAVNEKPRKTTKNHEKPRKTTKMGTS